MHDRALVGSDDVHTPFQGGAQVVNGRLTGGPINRGILEQHIRATAQQEIEVIPDGYP